jgi:hypothetical protein
MTIPLQSPKYIPKSIFSILLLPTTILRSIGLPFVDFLIFDFLLNWQLKALEEFFFNRITFQSFGWQTVDRFYG